jgi:hypothetical protein
VATTTIDPPSPFLCKRSPRPPQAHTPSPPSLSPERPSHTGCPPPTPAASLAPGQLVGIVPGGRPHSEAEKMAGGRLLLGGDFLSPPPLPPLPPPPLPPLPPPPPEPVLEQWRYSHESDWQWALRRSFICRHLHSYPGAALDQLLALSAAWTNHVFLGCR